MKLNNLVNPKASRSLKFVLKIFFKDFTTGFSFIVLFLYILATILVYLNVIPPLPPPRGYLYMYKSPSLENFPWYILGTEGTGRPLFLCLVRAAAPTLTVAFLSALITTIVGMLMGLIAGYLGGKIDGALNFLITLALTIPSTFLALIISALLPANLRGNLLVGAGVLSITAWGTIARGVRAQVVSLKRREFIEVAKALGFGARYIIFKEIMRYILPYITMQFVLAMVNGIYGYTSLSFLGIIPVSADNWGYQINLATSVGGLYAQKLSVQLGLWGPIIAIVLIQFSLANVARAFEEVFNPALRTKIEEGE